MNGRGPSADLAVAREAAGTGAKCYRFHVGKPLAGLKVSLHVGNFVGLLRFTNPKVTALAEVGP